jgi:predicted TIM-barrel fold metal-dependent hydrolase|tara:strand:+ start:285 stop:524 length:240 start_codon:yes stop_codon:yes gene_type:complete
MEPKFAERWAKFMEKYPDRMMFGSNIFLRKMRKRRTQNTYREIIHSVRMMIGSLSKEVQKQIMYETPIKVFRLNLKTHQ